MCFLEKFVVHKLLFETPCCVAAGERKCVFLHDPPVNDFKKFSILPLVHRLKRSKQ